MASGGALKIVRHPARRALMAGMKQSAYHQKLGESAAAVLAGEGKALELRKAELIKQQKKLNQVRRSLLETLTVPAAMLRDFNFRLGCVVTSKQLKIRLQELAEVQQLLRTRSDAVAQALARLELRQEIIARRLRDDRRLRRAASDSGESAEVEELSLWRHALQGRVR